MSNIYASTSIIKLISSIKKVSYGFLRKILNNAHHTFKLVATHNKHIILAYYEFNTSIFSCKKHNNGFPLLSFVYTNLMSFSLRYIPSSYKSKLFASTP